MKGAGIGIFVALLLGGIAFGIDALLDAIGVFSLGASMTAFVLGAICAHFSGRLVFGGRWLTKKVMPVAIVLLGFGLNLTLFFQPEVGLVGLLSAVAAAVTSFVVSCTLGRRMGLDLSSSAAIGAGCAICGNSAIVAVAPALKLSEERLAVALAIVNLLGLATFFFAPLLSSVFGLSTVDAGIWAGSIIHAVPQAVAAGEAIGGDAMVIATAVKLARVSLLVLVVPLCVWIGGRLDKAKDGSRAGFSLPYFVPGFILAAALSTWVVPPDVSEFLLQCAKAMLLPILAAVGFFISKDSLKGAGGAMLLLGTVSTVLMGLVSYLILVIT